jgi:two-component system, cell cycle response regulator
MPVNASNPRMHIMTHVERETILCVDAEEPVLEELARQLHRHFAHECDIATAHTAEQALALLDTAGPVAVIVVDETLPGMTGVDLLEIVHQRSPLTTKVLLTGKAGARLAIAAINRAHLNHYMTRPWEEARLRLVVENLLRQYRLARENRRLVDDLSAKNRALLEMNRALEEKVAERTRALEVANERLARLAETDGLTGLHNHRSLRQHLQREIERSNRNRLPLSLLMIDVDHFKQYNDRHGHPAGDEVLRQLARLMDADRRANDLCARYGGEEFVMLLVDTEKQTAALVAERLLRHVASHDFPHADTQPGGRLSISVGVASYPVDAASAAALVEAADQALYQAKREGRNRVAQYQDADADSGRDAVAVKTGS